MAEKNEDLKRIEKLRKEASKKDIGKDARRHADNDDNPGDGT